MSATHTGATLTSNCIDFIDEDDCRGSFFGLIEQITHTAGTDTDEHFHEFRTGNREERHTGLTSDSFGQ
ncbi:hypothetical protein SDC9_82679 [bioreactor metagenome]|uniref:Uncharacterized protein n=1 Tax=bioreactor metagenome TaxID=1076179 RepID=A0A644ZDW7_9ZZZZ